MSVEAQIFFVDWDEFVRRFRADPEGHFWMDVLRELDEVEAQHLLGQGESSRNLAAPTWIERYDDSHNSHYDMPFAELYWRMRPAIPKYQAERFEKFLGRFCLATANDYSIVGIQDVGPDLSEELFFSTMSPQTVEEYARLWRTIKLEALNKPFNKFYNKRQNEQDATDREESPERDDFDSWKDYLLYRWRMIFKRWETIPDDELDFQNFDEFKAIPEFWGKVITDGAQVGKGIVITVA